MLVDKSHKLIPAFKITLTVLTAKTYSGTEPLNKGHIGDVNINSLFLSFVERLSSSQWL